MPRKEMVVNLEDGSIIMLTVEDLPATTLK